MLKGLIATWIAAEPGRDAPALHRQLVRVGCEVSEATVYRWARGGGIQEHHKAPLAAALKVPVAHVLHAAADVPFENGA